MLPETDTVAAGAARRAGHGLDFLVVCDDYPALRAITKAVADSGGKLSCAPSPASALEYIARRKLDGIIVDLRVAGAMELIEAVRNGKSNKSSVVFACVTSSSEVTLALSAGANFVVHHPFTTEKIGQLFQSAAPLMAAEKRRYFRYPLVAPVNLKTDAKDPRATMSNLSEGGMAIWCPELQQLGATIGFSFELPFGGTIQGRGEVTWVNTEGLVGVKFHSLAEGAYQHLKNWLDRRMTI
ncbi:MAG TPA: response regulator [Candidatus Angelobacter sp.]|nr:response regulator [Candidatus Angelobacter sp.]